MYQLIKRLLLPPALPFLIVFAGLWLGGPGGVSDYTFLLIGIGLLYLCLIPYMGENLLAKTAGLAAEFGASTDEPPQVIIVLSGDLKDTVGGMAGDRGLGDLSLERVRHAARLHRETGLPILVTGRASPIMAAVLPAEFGVPVKWIENRSRRTGENASCSAELLLKEGVNAACLVTQDWHMPRAMLAFRSTGLAVAPAPASISKPARFSLVGLIPSIQGGTACYFAVYELLGLLQVPVERWLKQGGFRRKA